MSAPYSQSAVRLVRGQPAALDDVGERVVQVREVEVHADRRGCGHHAIAIEPDELSLGKQLQVLQVVRRLEALLVGERREHHALQRVQLRGVSGSAEATTRPFGSTRR